MPSVAHAEPVADFGTELIREWTPLGAPRAVVVLVHGIAEHSGRYERTGDILADNGFLVRSFDLRGGGGSGGERWDIEDWSLFHEQIARHMAWARSKGAPVVLMGHSMGGNLALGYLLSGRPAPDLMVLTAPALDGGAPWQKAVAGVAAKVIPTVVMPNGVKGGQLSRDPSVGEAYFADPLVHPRSSVRLGAAFFEAMGEVSARVDEIDIPTLVLHGGSDEIVPPQSTAILGEVAGVERRLLPGLRHEILNEPEGPDLVDSIIEWVDARLPSSG
jgi:alpha-beta hydrolase superfamily lysophospholipase